MVKAAVDRYGRLDAESTNAGYRRLCAITAMTEADFDQVIGINLKGVCFLSNMKSKSCYSLGNAARSSTLPHGSLRARPLDLRHIRQARAGSMR